MVFKKNEIIALIVANRHLYSMLILINKSLKLFKV